MRGSGDVNRTIQDLQVCIDIARVRAGLSGMHAMETRYSPALLGLISAMFQPFEMACQGHTGDLKSGHSALVGHQGKVN